MKHSKIILWRGFHSDQLMSLIAGCWQAEQLLVLIPPRPLSGYDFLDGLGSGEIHCEGEWTQSEIDAVLARAAKRQHFEYAEPLMFGIFTSGTTQQHEKLVLFSRKNVTSNIEGIYSLFDLERFDQIFSYPQPYHVFGLILGYVAAHLLEKKLIAPPGPYNHLHHKLRLSLQNPRTFTLLTPTHLRDLAVYKNAEAGASIVPSYSCILGGAAVTRADWLCARDQLNIQYPSIGYGCTEAGPGITHLGPGIEPAEDGSIGFALKHVSIHQAQDTDSFEFSGPGLAYVIIDKWGTHFPRRLMVHDKIVRQADGSYVFSARTDAVLNRGGEKFYLDEMEAALREALGAEFMCIALKDDRLGQELGLLAKDPAKVLGAFDFLCRRFSRRFEANNFRIVTDFPVNMSAKPDRDQAVRLFLGSRIVAPDANL